MNKPADDDAPLSRQGAFLVQFRSDSDVEPERLTGRVEHVASGHARRFHSRAELWAFIAEMLATLSPADGN